MRKIGRKILRIPSTAPNQVVGSEMIALPIKAAILTTSTRVLLTLRLLDAPYNSCPAARLIAFTDGLANNGYTFSGRVSASIAEECRPLIRLGQEPVSRAIAPNARQLSELPGALLQFKRSIAAASLWASHPHYAALRNPRTAEEETRRLVLNALRPPQLPATAHLAAVACVGLTLPTTEVARYKRATPLSVVAGGWSAGAIVHATTRRPPSAGPLLNRLGRLGFAYSPFNAGPHKSYDHSGVVASPQGSAPLPPLNQPPPFSLSQFFKPSRCPRCDDSNDDPFHLYLECPHHTLVVQRAKLRLSALSLLGELCLVVLNAADHEGLDLARRTIVYKDVSDLQRLCDGNAFSNKIDFNFVVFRLLCAHPFSARVADLNNTGLDLPLTLALGRVFDHLHLRGRWLRAINNLLVAWADKWTKDFATSRQVITPTT